MKTILWVIGLCQEENKEHLIQMLCKARKQLSSSDSSVDFIWIGEQESPIIKEAAKYADRVIAKWDSEPVDSDYYSKILSEMIDTYRPNTLLFPANEKAKQVAGMVSVYKGAGLTADCIDFIYEEDGTYIFSRTALSSTIIANIKTINTDLAFATVKRNAFSIDRAMEKDYAEIIEFKGTSERLKENRIKLLESVIAQKDEQFDLESASIIMGIGRGASDSETIKLARRVANKIGAELGGTRCLVEQGILTKKQQIGQSGVMVSPRIYFAFGISGASQHLVGIQNSKIIVAVNTDKNAAIFELADYAIIKDAREVLECMDKMLQEL